MDKFSSSLRTTFQRLRALFTGRRLDQEFDQEVETHIALLTEENIRRGMPAERARYAALKSFGGVAQVKEHNRERRTVHHLEILLQDLRYAFHVLRKNPGFTTVAVVMLTLGIGANTAIFQLLNAVRIRSLPVKNPQELVEIRPTDTEHRRGSFNRFGQLTYPLWEQISKHQADFSGMFAWGEWQFNLATGGQARYAKGMLVSGDFFAVLGVSPALGRAFTPADDQKGCGASIAVISYSFWQREFAGSPSAIGKKLSLDSHPVEIIGVTPANFFGFEIGHSYDVAVPLCAEAALRGENSRLGDGTTWWLVGVARLKPGSSVEQASAQLASISPAIFQSTLPSNYPTESIKNYLDLKLAAYPEGGGVSQLRNDYTDSLWLLLAASGLVLLIACANLANLMLARARTREREIAIRLALGASRGRLVRQLMTESLLLAAIGSLLGFWVAIRLSTFLVSFLQTSDNPIFLDLGTDWRVLGFTAGLAILTCVLFGLTAALRATGAEPAMAIKSGSRTVTSGREWFGLQRMLAVGQVSLSLALLAGALLFVRSLRNLVTLDAGFQQNGVVVASLNFNRLHVPVKRRLAFKQELLDRIATAPGIESVASADIIPIGGNRWSNKVWMEGSDNSPKPLVFFNSVSSDYFRTLGTPLLAGRTFNIRDAAASPKVAIVNEAFARKLTDGGNPVGRRFWRQQTPRQPQTLYEIVGLVKNTKYGELREDFLPIAFLASSQDQHPDLSMDILLRSSLPLTGVTSALKQTVGALSSDIDIDDDNLKTIIGDSLLRERLTATLSGFFAFLAALLATIGLYGVISYMVARRKNEIGIRMALGADRGRVVRLIMREAIVLVLIGLGIGVALALTMMTAARSMLYGLSHRDPITLFAAAGLLATVALAASHMPARRAARLDPLEALRKE